MRSDVQTEKSRKYHKIIKKIEKQKQEKLKKNTFLSETTRKTLFSFPFILTLFLLPFIFILFSLFVTYHRHILVLFLRRQH